MMPTNQKYARAASYDRYAIDLDKLYYHKIIRAVNRFSPTPGRLLDVGCFDGTLAAQFIPNWQVYGLEGNIDACRRALEKGVRAETQDLELPFPFESDWFDCVIAAEIIEHVYDTDRFLREIRRVMAPDGVLVMSIPNTACLTNRLKLIFGAYPRYAEYKAGGAGHIRVYTAPVIKSQLKENGFEVVYFAGCNFPLPMHHPLIPRWMKSCAAVLGEFFPNIAGQVILAAVKKSESP